MEEIELTEKEIQNIQKVCVSEIQRNGENADTARSILGKLGMPSTGMATKKTEEVTNEKNVTKQNFLKNLLKRFLKHAA